MIASTSDSSGGMLRCFLGSAGRITRSANWIPDSLLPYAGLLLACFAGLLCVLLDQQCWIVPFAFAELCLVAIYLKRPVLALQLLFAWTMAQNSVAIVLSPWISPFTLRLVLSYKEIAVVLMLTAAVLKGDSRTRTGRTEILGFAYLLVLLFYFVNSSAPFSARIVSLRQLSLPVAFFLLGRWTGLGRKDVLRIAKFVIVAALVAASFGLIERLLFPQDLWYAAGIRDFMGQKYGKSFGDGWAFYGGTYTSFALAKFGGPVVRRMLGPVANPVTFSYLLSLPLLLIPVLPMRVAGSKSNRALSTAWIGLAQLGTLGRGGIVTTLGAWFGVLLHRARYRIVLLGLALAASVAGIWYLVRIEYFGSHMLGLVQGAEFVLESPLGSGLGTTGWINVAARLLNTAGGGRALGGDSFAGVLVVQTGLVGCLLGYLFLLALVLGLLRTASHFRRRGAFSLVAIGLAWALLTMILTSILNEAAFAFTASATHLILAGLIVSLPGVDSATASAVAE